MDRPVNEKNLWCALVLLVVAIVVIVPTVFLSFHVVAYDKVAFRKPVYGSVDTSRIYQSGRHFLPLTEELVRFDNTYEPIAFLANSNKGFVKGIEGESSVSNPPLSVALADGVQIEIELFFEYRIDHTRLPQLYSQFGTTYISQIISIATATIKSAVNGFTQADYVARRSTVESRIAVAIETTIHAQLGVFAPSNKVKLLRVRFPDSVVATNLRAVMSVQNNEVAQLNQQVVAIESETSRQVAEVTAQQSQILAEAQIDADRIVAFAQNQAANVQTGARALGQATFFNTLGITNRTIQLEFVRLLNVLDTRGNITVVQGATSMNAILQA